MVAMIPTTAGVFSAMPILELTPIKGLSLKTNVGIDHSQYFNKVLTRKTLAADVNALSPCLWSG